MRLIQLYNRWTDELVRRLDAWILCSELERHKPQPLESGPPRFTTEPWCMTCVEPWPCATWEMRAEQQHNKTSG